MYVTCPAGFKKELNKKYGKAAGEVSLVLCFACAFAITTFLKT
jgi:hypothetical protein